MKHMKFNAESVRDKSNVESMLQPPVRLAPAPGATRRLRFSGADHVIFGAEKFVLFGPKQPYTGFGPLQMVCPHLIGGAVLLLAVNRYFLVGLPRR